MTRTELAIVIGVLEQIADNVDDEFEFSLEYVIEDPDERREFMREYYSWCEDPDAFDSEDDYATLPDVAILKYLAYRLNDDD